MQGQHHYKLFVIPEETFEGILSANDRSNVATGQANLLESAVQEALESIQNQDQEFDEGPPILSRDQSTATFNQPQVFNYDGGFVDMNKTPYAWALAFPTLFITRYRFLSGREMVDYHIHREGGEKG
jgi:hypothetical protein